MYRLAKRSKFSIHMIDNQFVRFDTTGMGLLDFFGHFDSKKH